jgi:methyl-accepting chemotaxis protein
VHTLSSRATSVFTPATAIVGRLRFARKFALIGLIMVVPLVYVVRAYVGVQSSGVSFANLEQAGLVYVKPVTTLLFDVIAARTAAVRAAAGEVPATTAAAARAEIAQAIAGVDAASGPARTLSLTSQWTSTRKALEGLLAAPSRTPAAAYATYNTMATDVEDLIAADGNNSNMILDPDNDSYYLMDAVLNRLTVLADTAGRAADLQTVITSSGQDSLVRRLGIEDLKGTILTTLSNSDPDYAAAFQNTHDAAMRAQLKPLVTAVDAAMAAVSAQLSAAVTGRPNSRAAHPLAAAAEAQALRLDHATFPVIGVLLGNRISGFDSDSTQTEVIALLGVLLAAYLFAGFYLSVRRSQGTIQQGLCELQTRCIDPLAAGLDAIATGDLTASLAADAPAIERSTADELGDVADSIDSIRQRILESVHSFNAMTGELREMIADVSQSAGVVSAASKEVSAASLEAGRATEDIVVTSADVASGAERQVVMIKNALDLAEEVTSAARHSAESARATADHGADARRNAESGVQAAEEADQAMRAVRDATTEVTNAIGELASKSSQIDAIMGTIIAIAEQTNLLALNAAIEAARAGEHGRGFAVVADEVRKLAEESQTSAGQINELVRTIQSDTKVAVEVAESGARRTQAGAEVVAQTREAFMKIDQSVQSMTERIESIAVASEAIVGKASTMQATIGDIAGVAEQSSASTQEVTASTEETSAATEEMAASAQELAGTAVSLEELVQRFRVH